VTKFKRPEGQPEVDESTLKWMTNLSEDEVYPQWVGYHIGRPKASATYTVEQLEGMGMVGIYEPPPSPFTFNMKENKITFPVDEVRRSFDCEL
jgi:hypothetical protein